VFDAGDQRADCLRSNFAASNRNFDCLQNKIIFRNIEAIFQMECALTVEFGGCSKVFAFQIYFAACRGLYVRYILTCSRRYERCGCTLLQNIAAYGNQVL
jgi:hypothetical protein